MTHVRLRVGQGDYAGAVALLRQILEREGDHVEARELLRSVEGWASQTPAEGPETVLEAPEAGDPRRLARAFRDALSAEERPVGSRIGLLERWLRKIRRGG